FLRGVPGHVQVPAVAEHQGDGELFARRPCCFRLSVVVFQRPPGARGDVRGEAAGHCHHAAPATRSRHRFANPARSAVFVPLAAKSSANRRGNRRVVRLAPRHTTVCGRRPAIASRRTVSRDTPSRRANSPAVRKSAASSAPPSGAGRGGGLSTATTALASASTKPGGTEGPVDGSAGLG